MSRSTPSYDKYSFKRYIKNIGRPYRKQAMELVDICRLFVQAQEQTPASDASLRVVLELVDDTLKAAADAGTKTSKEADEKFSEAIESLKEYEKCYHPNKSVETRMEQAKANDKSSSTVLNRLKETFLPIDTVPTKTVKFLIQESLLDPSPTTVMQELCETSDQKEVLWNFSRFKGRKERLTLKQNPHFYAPLPTSSRQYGGIYRSNPIANFQYETISVLTDGPDRVYMEISDKRRAFGGVWIANNAIIFKDVCGKLEGEGIVGGDIQNTHKLSCFEESVQSSTSRPAIQDWKEPILKMLQSQGVNRVVHITANQPGDHIPDPTSAAAPRRRPPSMRDRNPHTIRGTRSKAQNSKQNTSPPTTSTSVLASPSALSQTHAAHTAAPPSSVSPQPRTPPASSPRPAPTDATPAPPPSIPSQSRTSPASSPRPAPTAATAAPPAVPPQPRTSLAPSTRPAPIAATPVPSSSVPSQPRTSPASPHRPVPTTATAAPPTSVPSQPRTLPASSPHPVPIAAIAVPPYSVPSQPRTSPVSSHRPAPMTATAAPPSSVPPQPRTLPASSPRPAPIAATAVPPSSVPSQPRTSPASSPRLTREVAPPSSMASTISDLPSPQPPPTSTSPVTGVATSAPSIVRPPPDMSQNRGAHGGALQGVVQGTSRSPIPKAPSSDRSAATSTSLGVDRRIPTQAPGPSPRVEDPRTMVPDRASPPRPVPAQAIDSQPKPQPVSRKKNWFQAHVWDYGNK